MFRKRLNRVIALTFILALSMFISFGHSPAQTSDPGYSNQTTSSDDNDGFDAGWLGLLGLFGLMGLKRRHHRDEVHVRGESHARA